MINPEIIKRHPEKIIENIRRREQDFDVDKLIELDRRRREIQKEVDEKKSELNQITDKIAEIKREGGDISDMQKYAKELREKIKKLESEKDKIDARWRELILLYPNIVHESVPDKEAKIVKVWGEPIKLAHHIPHWEIGKKIGLRFELGATISGSGFTVLEGLAAKLERALINFMVDTHVKHGYTEYFAPYLVKGEAMIGTGQLPKFADDMYCVEIDNLWLIPTAEVTLVNLFRDSVIMEDKLTIKCVSYSACFRREAGSWGRETRGIVRQHQFNKVELVKITSPEKSYDELEELLKDACRILELLKLPYRVVLLPANDIGFSSSKTYDIEVWMPGYGGYIEISSCSNCEDFQARRAMIRIRRKNGQVQYAHTLNGSGVAVGRCLAAILENYLMPDGKIKIPEVLRDYIKADLLDL